MSRPASTGGCGHVEAALLEVDHGERDGQSEGLGLADPASTVRDDLPVSRAPVRLGQTTADDVEHREVGVGVELGQAQAEGVAAGLYDEQAGLGLVEFSDPQLPDGQVVHGDHPVLLPRSVAADGVIGRASGRDGRPRRGQRGVSDSRMGDAQHGDERVGRGPVAVRDVILQFVGVIGGPDHRVEVALVKVADGRGQQCAGGGVGPRPVGSGIQCGHQGWAVRGERVRPGDVGEQPPGLLPVLAGRGVPDRRDRFAVRGEPPGCTQVQVVHRAWLFECEPVRQ